MLQAKSDKSYGGGWGVGAGGGGRGRKLGKREAEKEKRNKAAEVGYAESCPEEWTLRKWESQTAQRRGHLVVK